MGARRRLRLAGYGDAHRLQFGVHGHGDILAAEILDERDHEAVIEEASATTLVGPGDVAELSEHGFIVIHINRGKAA